MRFFIIEQEGRLRSQMNGAKSISDLAPFIHFFLASAGRDGHGGFAIAGARDWIAEQVPDAVLLFR
jgi:hypothetical protein